MNEKWTRDTILEAMETMNARFLQNADYLFCNPADYVEMKNLIGDKLNVKSNAGVDPGKIYLVDRSAIEQYRTDLFEQETEE